MFTLIFTILIVYFGWLVVKPWLARYMRRRFERKVNDMFRQAFGVGADSYGSHSTAQQRERQHAQQAPRQPRRKIFSRDEGEYVEFEEIHITTDYTTSTSGYSGTSASTSSNPHGYNPREPRITDADWEEIV